MINLGIHFSHVDGRNSERARQRQWFIRARQERQKKEELAEKLEDDTAALAVDAIMATSQQIKEFEIKLEKYETATVTALMENQKQLDAVNARIEELLSRAYVMEDGRRVFKTIDGSQVFDEFGKEVTRDELDFDLIAESNPRWENLDTEFVLRNDLIQRKDNILKFQEEVDKAQEQNSKGKMTQAEMEKIEAKLEAEVPQDVMDIMAGYGQSELKLGATAEVKSQVSSPNIQSPAFTPM